MADANYQQPPAKRMRRDGFRGLEERIAAGETVLCAEGYLLAICRRGYITHGVWVPEFILEEPAVLRSVHEEFVHAGTDVIEAFQYYTHREKMKEVGREDDVEKINRIALRLAREIADNHGKLFAGGISKSLLYVPGDEEVAARVRDVFDEQVRWSKEEGADYIIAETLLHLGEAKIALEVIKSYGLPAVITFALDQKNQEPGCTKTLDGVPIAQACKKLLDEGATLVGVNCYQGPELIMKTVEEIVKVCPPERVCALPIAYRTTPEEPTFLDLTDKYCTENNPAYPHGIEPFCVSPVEITSFTKRCLDLGMKYLGICCGNSGQLTRSMAEAMGRTPPASRYYDPSKKGCCNVYKNQKQKLQAAVGNEQ